MHLSPTTRYHALDALRAGAMFLGVVLHAALGFSPTIPSTFGSDAEVSRVFDVVFDAIHGFRMELFFLLAGFFADLLLRRYGAAGLMRNRARRIALPFLVGVVLLFGIDQLLLRWAAVLGSSSPDLLRSTPRPLHLWFLYYLLMIEAAFLVASAVELQLTGPRLARVWRAGARLAPFVLPALIVCTAVLLQRGPRAQYNDFRPVALWLLHYGVFFATGVVLHRLPSLREQLTWTAPAFVLIAAFTFLAQQQAESSRLFATLTAIYAWTATLGLLGLALKYLSSPSPLARSLADASYWVYLTHYPVVCAMQLALRGTDWPAAIEFTAVLAVGTAVPLWTWVRFVRGTVVGNVLGSAPRGAASTSPKIATV
jgi:peptidoglycan/LPS O-acetylase OafA/YrhL